MKEEKILGILHKTVTHIKKLGSTIDDDFDVEAIHDFRTSTKKLRTFLRLLELNSPEKGPKLTTKFKKLYQIAGNIRDTQLAIEHMNQQDVPVYYRAMLHDLAACKKNWQQLYAKKLLVNLHKRLTDVKLHPLHPHVLKLFLNNKLDELYRLSEATHPDDETIHDLRKVIKDIVNIADFTNKKWRKGVKHVCHLPADELQALADTIGEYNDNRIQTARIASFEMPGMPAQEKKLLEAICTRQALQQRGSKAHIMTMTKALLAKL